MYETSRVVLRGSDSTTRVVWGKVLFLGCLLKSYDFARVVNLFAKMVLDEYRQGIVMIV